MLSQSYKINFVLNSLLVHYFNLDHYNFIFWYTVKLGYNELGYNEHPVITSF